ncbi:MAG: nucleotidyl transferase AbiEii/AbiGii toxin family protein [bacterium]
MIQTDFLKNFFPLYLWNNPAQRKYIIKEYIQLLILDYLSTTQYINKIVFIGGTNLRLTKGIDRFSEDLDFDCKKLSNEEFIKMTDDIIKFLQRFGFMIQSPDQPNDKLKAFRRNIYFPELLFELGLSGYREERFLIKIKSQDQQIYYKHKLETIKGCGLYFKFPVPDDEIMCAMKISALLSRQKGRDFYDVMFLMEQTKPDYSFLSARCGIKNQEQLKHALKDMLQKIDLSHKAKDFEHLAFQERSIKKIMFFDDFVNDL